MASTTKIRPKETVGDKRTPPAFKARLGALRLAIWENTFTDEDGRDRPFRTATLERGFRDKDGVWQDSRIQLNERDFGQVIALLQAGQQFVVRTD